jgi:hypothetical protein
MQSLKAVEAEEVFDLILYRPLAFPLVVLLTPTPVTPNQVTLVAFGIAVGAGCLYGIATPTAVALAGVVYFVSRVFDCVDGQLARAQKSGSKLGKFYDGLSDYFGHAAIFVGLAFAYGGGEFSRPLPLPLFGVVTLPAFAWAGLTGLSLVYVSVLADKYKNEYLSRKVPGRATPEEELGDLRVELEQSSGLTRVLLSVFTSYLALQARLGKGGGEGNEHTREIYCRHNKATLFAWNLLGPSMQASFLVALSILGRVDLFIPFIIIFFNLATIPFHLWQWLVNRRVRALVAVQK